jgi:cytochrome b561
MSSIAAVPGPARVSRYHWLLVVLHWAAAFLILAALYLGATKLVAISNTDPMKTEGLKGHMTGGAMILSLMLVRLVVRLATRHPGHATTGNAALNHLAVISHRGFYIVVLTMAGSGLFMAIQTGVISILAGGHPPIPPDFWAFKIRYVHYVLSRVIMVMVAVHVGAVIFHTFVVRDGLLRRMWFGRRTAGSSV